MTHWTIGIDEAGRGPLAGPVAVGAFAVPDGFDMELLKGIRDSKKISEKKRTAWEEKLTGIRGVRHAVGYASATQIDVQGIVPAIKDAMASALRALKLDANDCKVLLDGGLHAPVEYADQKTIVHGDDKEPTISAAAILAKTGRDKNMCKLDEMYPEYGLAKHKGYGTKLHRECIAKHGFSPVHRRTFCKNIKITPVERST